MATAIGIDLGGTRIKSVLIDAEGNILQQLYTDTRDGDDKVWKQAVLNNVAELKKQVDKDDLITGISAPEIGRAHV